ncbi:hypothetical protein GT034_30390 [Streptomyces sp. SID2563]|uniref:hypothetical protein n=1 Tax=Streptomyces sp. SID2563 TaxID=2690255 RepID=UPI00136AC32B|nr:hypothetical protein [Streptomyces sp. SID2563]MYW12623.1 hypothetical protein [Streptomyces sp. SID2563]
MHDYDDQAVSNRLGQHQNALDDSLAGVLDTEAGLREILIHSRHYAAVDALGSVLNSEAGLTGILSPTPQPQASDTSGTHRPLCAGDILTALSPADRMALRNRSAIKEAQRALVRDADRFPDLDRALDLARDIASALDRDLASASHLDVASNLDLASALARTSTVTRILARDINRNFSRELVHARFNALTIRDDIVRALDRAVDPLDDAIARDVDRALGRARDLALVLASDFNRDVLIESRTKEVCRAIGWALRREPPALDAASVTTFLNDFTHDDLRGIDLRRIDFSGVHWSQRTQWPSSVDIEALKARSDEMSPGSGIWIVRSGTTTVRGFADLA